MTDRVHHVWVQPEHSNTEAPSCSTRSMRKPKFLNVRSGDHPKAAELSKRLREAGFEVLPARHAGGLSVLVDGDDTDQENKVRSIVEEVAPGIKFGPPTTPA